VLLFIHLKFFRERGLNSSLKFLNLLTIKGIVIKDLPFLGSTLIEVAFAFTDLLLTENVFNPHFKFNENFTSACVVKETSGTTVTPLNLHHVVFSVEITVIV
jgi:hypothetical protein